LYYTSKILGSKMEYRVGNFIIFDMEVLHHALEITAAVFVMMIIIDWVDVRTQGRLQNWVIGNKLRQYILSSFLGVTPGCMGSYMNVSLYMHGFFTIGAIVGGMIATTGEASLVMFARFPAVAIMLHFVLLILEYLFWFFDRLHCKKF